MIAEAVPDETTQLVRWVEQQKTLTPGWKQKLSALMDGLDRERIVSHLRIDGANWFVSDQSVLISDEALDELDEIQTEDAPADESANAEGADDVAEDVYADDEAYEDATELSDGVRTAPTSRSTRMSRKSSTTVMETQHEAHRN